MEGERFHLWSQLEDKHVPIHRQVGSSTSHLKAYRRLAAYSEKDPCSPALRKFFMLSFVSTLLASQQLNGVYTVAHFSAFVASYGFKSKWGLGQALWYLVLNPAHIKSSSHFRTPRLRVVWKPLCVMNS